MRTGERCPASEGHRASGGMRLLPGCGNVNLTQSSSSMLGEASTETERGSYLYRSHVITGINCALWLPTGTGSPASDLGFSSGLPKRTAGRSWFSATRTTASSGNSQRIYSPSFTPSPPGCTGYAGTATVLRLIWLYPTSQQKKMLRLWFDAARWCYNQASSTTTTRYEKTRSGLLLQLRTVHHGRLALVRCQLQNPPTSYLVG